MSYGVVYNAGVSKALGIAIGLAILLAAGWVIWGMPWPVMQSLLIFAFGYVCGLGMAKREPNVPSSEA